MSESCAEKNIYLCNAERNILLYKEAWKHSVEGLLYRVIQFEVGQGVPLWRFPLAEFRLLSGCFLCKNTQNVDNFIYFRAYVSIYR